MFLFFFGNVLSPHLRVSEINLWEYNTPKHKGAEDANDSDEAKSYRFGWITFIIKADVAVNQFVAQGSLTLRFVFLAGGDDTSAEEGLITGVFSLKKKKWLVIVWETKIAMYLKKYRSQDMG